MHSLLVLVESYALLKESVGYNKKFSADTHDSRKTVCLSVIDLNLTGHHGLRDSEKLFY